MGTTSVNLQKEELAINFKVFDREKFPHLIERVESELDKFYEEQEWHFIEDIYVEENTLYFWINSGWDRNSSRVTMFSYFVPNGKLSHVLNPDEMFIIQSKIDSFKGKLENRPF